MLRMWRTGGRVLAGGITLALALQFVAPGTTLAATSIQLNPTSGPVNSLVMVTGQGYFSGEEVDISFSPFGVVQVTHAFNNGNFSATFQVPGAAAAGQHTVAAIGQTSGHTASAPFTVTTQTINVNLQKSVSVNNGAAVTNTSAQPGDTLTYFVRYTNAGSAQAQSVTITDVLQGGQTFLGATTGCSIVYNGNGTSTVTCPIGNVAANGGTGQIFIATQVNSNFQGVIYNTARYTATNGPANPNPSNTTVVTVGHAPPPPNNSTLTKVVAVNNGSFGTNVVAAPGDTLTYQIRYVNTSSSAATNVVIYDPLQSGQSFYRIATSAGTCGATNFNTLTCSVGYVAPGVGVNVTITTIVNASFGGQISNRAYVNADNQNGTIASNWTYVSVSQVSPPPPVTNFTNITLCGPVSYVSLSSITVSGVTIPFAGTPVGTLPASGSNVCIAFALNSAGQATQIAITSNLAGVNTACGVYSATGNPNTILVGGVSISVINGATFFPFLTSTGNYCFLLTPSGQAYAVLSGIPTAAHVIGGNHRDANRPVAF